MTTDTAQIPYQDITGVILAGGRGTRLGGADKGLEELAGRPLIAHGIAALTPQTGTLLVNANRNNARYAAFGYPVISDEDSDFPGPLGGILSALRAARTAYVLCVPCDAPLLPVDLTARLWSALTAAHAAASVAHDGERLQPVYALLSTTLAGNLRDYLDGGARGTGDWLRSLPAAQADFSDCPRMFLNMNTPDDRARLARAMDEARAC